MGLLFETLKSLGVWTWWVAAGILFLLELLAPGIFFLWLGVAAVIVAVTVLVVDISWQIQIAAFAVLSVVTLIASKRFFSPNALESDQPNLNKRVMQYVGKVYVLDEAIVNGSGSLKIGDSIWRVRGPDMAAGTRVEVIGTEGATLTVEASQGARALEK